MYLNAAIAELVEAGHEGMVVVHNTRIAGHLWGGMQGHEHRLAR